MTLIIQIVLIAAIVAIMVRLLATRTTRSRAWATLLGVAFTVFAIVAIAFPNVATRLANLVGIGRGADLLLYGLALVVLVIVVQTSLVRHANQRRTARIVRSIVLLRADLEHPESIVAESEQTPEHSPLVSTGSTNDEANSTDADEGITHPGDSPLPEP